MYTTQCILRTHFKTALVVGVDLPCAMSNLNRQCCIPESKLHHASRPCYAANSIAGTGMVQHAIHSPRDTNLLDLQCANDLVATLNTHIASAQQLLCYCARPLWAAVYIGRHQVALPSLLCRLHITIQRRKKKKQTPKASGTYALSICTLSVKGQETFNTRVGGSTAPFFQQNETLGCRLGRVLS